MPLNRRDFLSTTAAAGLASGLAAPAIATAAKTPQTYKTALIGTGWWGTNILREALGSGECKCVALCDVDDRQVEKCAGELSSAIRDQPKRYKDYRELLDKEKPDIAIVATPDHWHPLITIAAVKGGANVYVEKPIGHTIYEGRAMVQAARDAGKIVQVGTHRRVSPHNVSGMKFLKDGKAGKIGMVRAFVHYPGGAGRPTPDSETPKGLDWDMWCGPGPMRPFNAAIHPKGFRGFLDYANGTLGDWGIHWMDQILWWTDEKYPKTVSSFAARHIRKDNSDAHDTQVASFEFDSFTAVWEHRQYAGNTAEKTHPQQAVGCYFYGTEGTFHMGWLDGWTFYPSDSKKAPIHQDAQLHEPDQQNIRELFANFLQCIKDGQRPISDIEVGHRSTNMALLGMLSAKIDRSIHWDGEKQVIVGDDAANALLRREYRKPWEYPI
jgi:predicted dehydrogenase